MTKFCSLSKNLVSTVGIKLQQKSKNFQYQFKFKPDTEFLKPDSGSVAKFSGYALLLFFTPQQSLTVSRLKVTGFMTISSSTTFNFNQNYLNLKYFCTDQSFFMLIWIGIEISFLYLEWFICARAGQIKYPILYVY